MEQLDYNILFRWSVGLEMDEPMWVPPVFTKNRDRVLNQEVARLAGSRASANPSRFRRAVRQYIPHAGARVVAKLPGVGVCACHYG